MTALEAVGDRVARKMVNVLGSEQAERVAADVLRSIGLAGLDSPDARFLFGARLVERGGLLAVIGRSIQTQAQLHGAMVVLDRMLASRPSEVP